MKTKYKILVSITPLWIVIDQVIKHLMVSQFQVGESITVISGFFNITYVRNPGVAFGFLGNLEPAIRTPLLLFIPVVALIAMSRIFCRLSDFQRKSAIGLALIAAGAIGNLIDRVQLGFVVDSFDFHWQGDFHYPAFNWADVGICLGVILLMIEVIKNPALEKVSSLPQ